MLLLFFPLDRAIEGKGGFFFLFLLLILGGKVFFFLSVRRLGSDTFVMTRHGYMSRRAASKNRKKISSGIRREQDRWKEQLLQKKLNQTDGSGFFKLQKKNINLIWIIIKKKRLAQSDLELNQTVVPPLDLSSLHIYLHVREKKNGV